MYYGHSIKKKPSEHINKTFKNDTKTCLFKSQYLWKYLELHEEMIGTMVVVFSKWKLLKYLKFHLKTSSLVIVCLFLEGEWKLNAPSKQLLIIQRDFHLIANTLFSQVIYRDYSIPCTYWKELSLFHLDINKNVDSIQAHRNTVWRYLGPIFTKDLTCNPSAILTIFKLYHEKPFDGYEVYCVHTRTYTHTYRDVTSIHNIYIHMVNYPHT